MTFCAGLVVAHRRSQNGVVDEVKTASEEHAVVVHVATWTGPLRPDDQG